MYKMHKYWSYLRNDDNIEVGKILEQILKIYTIRYLLRQF